MSAPPWYRDNSPHASPAKRRAQRAEDRVRRQIRVDRIYEERRRRDELDRLRPPIDRERAPRPVVVRVARDPRKLSSADLRGGSFIDNATGKPTDPRVLAEARRRLTKHASNPKALRRALRPLLRRFNPLDYMQFLAEIAESVSMPNPGLPPLFPAGSGWYWCKGPVAWPPGYVWAVQPRFASSGSCTVNVPLVAQAASQSTYDNWYTVRDGLNVSQTGNDARRYWNRLYRTGNPSVPFRSAIVGTARRTKSTLESWDKYGGWNKPWHPVWNNAGYDPNVIRALPGLAPSAEQAAVSRAVERSAPRMMLETGEGGIGGGPPVRAWTRLRRPGGRTSEGKAGPSSSAPKFGIWLYRILGEVSEGAELVDAVYDALPADVKRRWDRPDKRGDQFGQYGIEGADWKLRALWYNWHRVDVAQAAKNIIKNNLSDKVIGDIQRRLPRNVGNAHQSGEMEFARKLDEILDFILDDF